MFTLRIFLLRHHGKINRILLSYSKWDSPSLNQQDYEKWYKDTNKDFWVDMDLQHTSQKLDDFKQLAPYLDLEVTCWDFFEKDKILTLEVSLK